VTKYAYYSKVGAVPNNQQKQNQDSFIVAPKLSGRYSEHLFGVADGHGQYGKEVSSCAKQQLPSTSCLRS
jgi:serine/threonine protein phosphatase PrpC